MLASSETKVSWAQTSHRGFTTLVISVNDEQRLSPTSKITSSSGLLTDSNEPRRIDIDSLVQESGQPLIDHCQSHPFSPDSLARPIPSHPCTSPPVVLSSQIPQMLDADDMTSESDCLGLPRHSYPRRDSTGCMEMAPE